MWWRALIAILAGCGRIDFDVLVVPIGHDEDGDGVPDTVDVCPHLAGSQADGDGDGIGDACDPQPTLPAQRLLLFGTLRPGDVPFEPQPLLRQDVDSLHFDGIGDGTGGVGFEVSGLSYQNLRVAIGVDVTAVVAPAAQHQLALHPADVISVHDFVELNENGIYSQASITAYDGAGFTSTAQQDLPNRFHTGHVELQATAFDGGTMYLDGGWTPSEIYHLQSASNFGPGTIIHIDVNNLEVDVRYIWAVTW